MLVDKQPCQKQYATLTFFLNYGWEAELNSDFAAETSIKSSQHKLVIYFNNYHCRLQNTTQNISPSIMD